MPIGNPFTIQVGGSFSLNFWFIAFNFSGGFAVDSKGHVATYTTRGVSTPVGGAGSIGTQVSYSNAATVCGLSGPFVTASEVDTVYDGLGRVYTVSNPHTGTGAPTDGLTTYTYDALNRTTAVQAPDGSTASTTFAVSSLTYCSTVTDPASKARTLCSDGLGRVTAATEDPGVSPHLNYQTTYTYNLLNDLTGVTQGSQTRTYNYDMLGRLTSAQIPEVNVGGTQCSTTYGYDANANLTSKTAPLENQNSSCSTTVTTTYAYDAVNRLTSKTYNDSTTPTANFFYDQAPSTMPAWSGVSFSYAKGRMVLACSNTTVGTCTSPTTAAAYSYDPVGRIQDFWQCTQANCGTSSIWDTHYNYDLAGDVTSWVHPGQFTLTNTVNSAQQVTAIQSSLADATHPQYLAQSISYTPWGAVSTLQNGCVGSSCVNAQETYQYNKRLQPWVISLAGASGTGYCLVYNYYADESNPTSCAAPTQGSQNNGNVMGYWYQDSSNSSLSHTATYSYDNVNRLSTAVATGNWTYNLAFSYDLWGNMTCVQNGSTNGPCPQWSYTPGTNQLASSSGFTYDAAGNLINDSVHTYQWDAEGHVISIDSGNTASETFNAMGWRVYRTNGTRSYWVDPQGRFLGGYWGIWNAAVPFGGRMLGNYTPGTPGPLYFDHPNALGSTGQGTDVGGHSSGELLFYPWGQKAVDTANGSLFQYYASLLWYDPEADGYQPPNRYYIPRHGRWLTPDPLGGDITNPQSLNRYAYVLNNPCTLRDPLGLESAKCSPSDNAIKFMINNLQAAQDIADNLDLPVQNILGLSGMETGYGTNRNARLYANYFSVGAWTARPSPSDLPAYATSSWGPSGKGLYYATFNTSVNPNPGMAPSGQWFTATYGDSVFGLRSPDDFATELSQRFNPTEPGFRKALLGGIKAIQDRMGCSSVKSMPIRLTFGGRGMWFGPSWWQQWALYQAGNLGLTPESQTQTNDHGPGSGWYPDGPPPTLTRR